jgi:hypothetical protein
MREHMSPSSVAIADEVVKADNADLITRKARNVWQQAAMILTVSDISIVRLLKCLDQGASLAASLNLVPIVGAKAIDGMPDDVDELRIRHD